MCRPSHSSMKLLLLSQQLCLKNTKFSQLLGLLRDLLVKQGYFLPFGDKYILDELGLAACCWSLSRDFNMALIAVSPL